MKKLRNLISMAVVVALSGCTGASDSAGGFDGSGSTSGGVISGGAGSPGGSGTGEGTVQSGTLTAGEYDDHLNLENYQQYLNTVLQGDGQELPYIDIASKLTIKVVDANTMPVATVRVAIEVEQTEVITVTTAADGQAFLYEGLDGLPDTFDITLSYDGLVLNTLPAISLAEISANGGLNIVLDNPPVPARQLDLMLVVDTTSSMADEVRFLKAELRAIIDEVVAKNTSLDVQVGLVVYRDIGDAYVSRSFDLTSDIFSLQANLQAQNTAGGGDYPEAMQVGLSDGLAASWRKNSTKIMLLVADAPPKDKDIGEAWHSVLEAREQQIHIVPVAASSSGPVTEFLMRAMAVATQSRYLFLTDDSGVGNTHDEPSVDCYVVTRLDNAIIRAIDTLISGERVFPMEEEIVRKEGGYREGVCEPENTDQ